MPVKTITKHESTSSVADDCTLQSSMSISLARRQYHFDEHSGQAVGIEVLDTLFSDQDEATPFGELTISVSVPSGVEHGEFVMASSNGCSGSDCGSCDVVLGITGQYVITVVPPSASVGYGATVEWVYRAPPRASSDGGQAQQAQQGQAVDTDTVPPPLKIKVKTQTAVLSPC